VNLKAPDAAFYVTFHSSATAFLCTIEDPCYADRLRAREFALPLSEANEGGCDGSLRPNGGDYEPGNVIWGTWDQQVLSRAAADPCALSLAGKKGAAIRQARMREALEREGQGVFAFVA